MNYIYPNRIDNLSIYDILHNDNNELIIVTPGISNPRTIKNISDENNVLTFELHVCPHNHTIIYKLNDIEYNKKIKLMVNDLIVETHVNKYPSFTDEIIFSTLVKDEDAFMLPWIDYHRKLGVSRFIIYDNSTNFTLSDILDEYIKNKIVVLIKWDHPYGNGCQQTEQNHSIYAFRSSKYIGLFDVDEYVNPKGTSNLHSLFENIIAKENIDVNEIGGFTLFCKSFFNPNNLDVNNGQFLKIFNCDVIARYDKNFVLPKNVITYSVHAITSGKPMYDVKKEYGFFNHYIYLNKSHRGRDVTSFTDDSILFHLEN